MGPWGLQHKYSPWEIPGGSASSSREGSGAGHPAANSSCHRGSRSSCPASSRHCSCWALADQYTTRWAHSRSAKKLDRLAKASKSRSHSWPEPFKSKRNSRWSVRGNPNSFTKGRPTFWDSFQWTLESRSPSRHSRRANSSEGSSPGFFWEVCSPSLLGTALSRSPSSRLYTVGQK